MKKFIFILSLIFVALIGNAQTVTFNPLPLTDSKFVTASPYVITDATVRTFYLETSKQTPTTQDFYMKLDSLTGNHTYIAVALYGAKFSDTAYSQIGSTITWKGTTTSHDTTIVISNATSNRYNFFKWTVTGTGTGTSRVVKQSLKLYLEKN